MKKILLLLNLLVISSCIFAQGTETFTNMPASSGSYLSRTWTGDNGLTWTATDSRTDQTLNGKAIGVRIGVVACSGIPNGMGTLQFSYKYLFTAGGDARLVVRVNGDSIGQIMVPTTAITTQNSPVFSINKTGTINLELVQANPLNGSGPRAAIDDVTWTGYSNTPCTTPAAQASGLGFSGISTTGINGAFSAGSPVADKYLVLISRDNALTQQPVNGATYTLDDNLGNATVIGNSTALTFSATALSPATTYNFYVYAANDLCSGGPLYNLVSPLTGNSTTATPPVCASPVAQITNFSFGSLTSTTISGTFSGAPDADSYLITVSSSETLGFSPANGTSYSEGQTVGSGKVIKAGTGTTFLAYGLSANTTYYFNVFSETGSGCTGGPLYNITPFKASGTTTNSDNNIPAGYYGSITTQTCASLKTEIKNIITNGMQAKSYSDLPVQYAVTDIKPREVGTGSASVIWDIYSDKPGANNDPYNMSTTQNSCGSGEGSGWNREHSVPQSWFTGGTATGPGTDYHHIFPTDCSVNSARGSFIYGEVASANYTSLNGSKRGSSAIAGFTGDVFEPIDEYKGDVARAFLYFVTRYETSMTGWSGGANGTEAMDPTTYPSVDVPYLKVMLKWHNQDPVSLKEIIRNNGGYDFQRNRNPFVDHPEYADLVWNGNCAGLSALPVDLLMFSGKLTGNSVNLSWQVANEQNLQGYIIERSSNGRDYSRLNQLSAAGSKNYSYSDDISLLGGRNLYYRIRMANRDGSFTYSRIFNIRTPQNTLFSIYPNPAARGNVTVQLLRTVKTATLQIVDVTGRILVNMPVAQDNGRLNINTRQLPQGTYLVRLFADGSAYQSRLQVLK